jgi:beta-glucosidase
MPAAPHPLRALARLLALAACSPGAQASADDAGGSSSTGGEPPEFPAIGSIAAPGGKDSFRFGAASAATQIEDMNPAVDWWVWTAPPPDGLGRGTFVGDAAGGYSRALADVALLQALHLDSYRFSVEWARVEPRRDVVDEAALAHYDAFIDALVAAGIRPMITLHHFSNPVWVDDPRDPGCEAGPGDDNLCGWDHAEGGARVVEEFRQHAALLAERFGDRVDEWATVNEPINYVVSAYGLESFPPGKNGILADVDGILLPALRNYLAGHAAAYDALKDRDDVDADGDGLAAAVGFTQAVGEWVPARDNAVSDHPDDLAAQARLVWVYHLLFVEALRQGGFDPQIDGTLDEPHPEWKGRLDWLGVQYYFRAGVTAEPGLFPKLLVTPCFPPIDAGACVPPLDPTYRVPAMDYEHHPGGLYTVLRDLSTRWPDLPLTVTESGIATEVGARRAEVVVRALEQIRRARDEGADVRGYYHWSLYDNFEWALGFEPRFGLYRVDYADLGRTATEGAEVLAAIAAERRIGEDRGARYGGGGPLTPEP